MEIQTVTVGGKVYAAGGDPGGTMRAAWRVAARVKAGGACACCGEATRLDALPTDGDRAECGHLLPGIGRGGYQPGNLINLCRVCNSDMGDNDVRAMTGWANPGAVVTERPVPGQSMANTDEWDKRRKARIARGAVI